MVIHIFFMFPETAGKSLEEVEEMFLSNTKAWQTKVQYSSARKNELGDVGDVEKKLSYSHQEAPSDSDTQNVPATEVKA